MPATYQIYVRVTVPVHTVGDLTTAMKTQISSRLNADGIPAYFIRKPWDWIASTLQIEYVETIVGGS